MKTYGKHGKQTDKQMCGCARHPRRLLNTISFFRQLRSRSLDIDIARKVWLWWSEIPKSSAEDIWERPGPDILVLEL